MKKLSPVISSIGFTTLLLGCQSTSQKTDNDIKKPNFIFILADDLGYGDLGCYGQQKIRTPHIDKMASEGIRFTQFYAGSTVSAPSRCALMTGKHMGHAYIRGNSREAIPDSEITLAEVLKEAGYVTGMYGKWGLGENGTTGDPAKQGFDEFTGYNNQGEAHFYYTDTIDKIIDGKSVRYPIDITKYTHEIFADDALAFINKNKDNPFFLYLPFCIPHAELLVPKEDMKQYLDENGKSIFEEIPHAGGHYRKQDNPRAAYAAMVSKLDSDVGRIIETLKKLGLDKNTYVVFASDNGPHTAGGHDYTYFDGNGPLRGFKRNLYEGGIRVPMIVWSPGKIARGVESNVIWSFWDILPTFADIAEINYPKNIDGISFKETLLGKPQTKTHDYLYWEFGENEKKLQAIRSGKWKLLKILEPEKKTSYELYNLSSDLAEQINLFDIQKDTANRLIQFIEESCESPENRMFYDFKKLN